MLPKFDPNVVIDAIPVGDFLHLTPPFIVMHEGDFWDGKPSGTAALNEDRITSRLEQTGLEGIGMTSHGFLFYVNNPKNKGTASVELLKHGALQPQLKKFSVDILSEAFGKFTSKHGIDNGAKLLGYVRNKRIVSGTVDANSKAIHRLLEFAASTNFSKYPDVAAVRKAAAIDWLSYSSATNDTSYSDKLLGTLVGLSFTEKEYKDKLSSYLIDIIKPKHVEPKHRNFLVTSMMKVFPNQIFNNNADKLKKLLPLACT
jgi:hypothetical protein